MEEEKKEEGKGQANRSGGGGRECVFLRDLEVWDVLDRSPIQPTESSVVCALRVDL